MRASSGSGNQTAQTKALVDFFYSLLVTSNKLLNYLEIFYGNRFRGLGELEAEHSRVEIKLGIQRRLDAFCPSKAMLLIGECYVCYGDTLRAQRADHLLGLAWWHHTIL